MCSRITKKKIHLKTCTLADVHPGQQSINVTVRMDREMDQEMRRYQLVPIAGAAIWRRRQHVEIEGLRKGPRFGE